MTFALIPQKQQYTGRIKAFYEYLIADGLDPATAESFIEYHLSRKEIWNRFEYLALKAIEAGIKKWGSKGIMEMVRFSLSTTNRKYYPICNSMSAYYSRLFRFKYPQHKRFLREKRIRGLKKPSISYKEAA